MRRTRHKPGAQPADTTRVRSAAREQLEQEFVVGRLPAWWWRGGAGAGYGRLLGLGSLLTSVIALVLLQPRHVHWSTLLATGVLHLAGLWLSFAVPWSRRNPRLLLFFPLLTLAALVAVTRSAPELAGCLVGYFVLTFAYTGLFLPARASLLLLGPALLAYFANQLAVTPPLLVRALFGAIAWIVLSELLGALSRRQVELLGVLRHDADTDPLTGLANRRGLDRALAEAVPGDVLVVVDLDHFKQLNDERGHAAGDEVLRTLGHVLQRELRTRDRVARSGGEEFVVLLRCEEPRGGRSVGERLRTALAAECPGVTFSAGLAEVRADRSVHASLDAADAAMYTAKRSGRDRACVEPVEQLAGV